LIIKTKLNKEIKPEELFRAKPRRNEYKDVFNSKKSKSSRRLKPNAEGPESKQFERRLEIQQPKLAS